MAFTPSPIQWVSVQTPPVIKQWRGMLKLITSGAALVGCTTSWLGRVGIYFYFTFILPYIMWLSWYGGHPIFQWKSEAADTWKNPKFSEGFSLFKVTELQVIRHMCVPSSPSSMLHAYCCLHLFIESNFICDMFCKAASVAACWMTLIMTVALEVDTRCYPKIRGIETARPNWLSYPLPPLDMASNMLCKSVCQQLSSW